MIISQSLTRKPDFYGTVVTEVQVTCDTTNLQSSKPSVALPAPQVHQPTSQSSARLPSKPWKGSIAGRRHHAQHYIHGAIGAIPGVASANFETVCSSDSHAPQVGSFRRRLKAMKSRYSLKLKRLDPVKVAYLRTSFIFAFAVLVTWIPSSINRLFSLSHNRDVSFELSLASGCVLPLQGVWNAIIFLTTS